MVTKKVHLNDSQEALQLLGQNDQNLRTLERTFGVQVFGRGHVLSVRGTPSKVDKTLLAIEEMRENLTRQSAASDANVADSAQGQTQALDSAYANAMGRAFRPRTATQKEYLDAVAQNDLVVAIGPAGTGKTFLAVASALAALKTGEVDKIVLTRPVVEAGEKLGFLPGDLYEKINPYLRPLYDAFHTMLGPDRFRLYRDEETIEICPLAYMRGRTLERAVIILDEAQNSTPEQMKMFLTRAGLGSKIIINGDVTQIDLPSARHSGLIHLPLIVKGIPRVKVIHFTDVDVVRHPLVRELLKAYDEWEKHKERP